LVLLFPKPIRRKKPPKSLRRSRVKRAKGSFKASDNGKRTPRRDPAEVRAWAMAKQAEKRAELSPAQLAIGAFLARQGIRFEYETYWENGDYPIFSDIFIPSLKLTIECDGDFHRQQRRADIARALYLARRYGIGTLRVWNRDCPNGKAEARLKQQLGLS
jgi:very-short-patch-repair endonuclease